MIEVYDGRILYLATERRSDLDDFFRARPFGPRREIELYGLAFGEGLEALALYGCMVHEDIFAVILRDEAIALLVAEPLDLSCRHRPFTSLLCPGLNPGGFSRACRIGHAAREIGLAGFLP